MLSIGTLVWISLRPLLRLAICAGSGFIITKADIFPSAAASGAGQILLNILLPCLMFSKIVPAFAADNIRVLIPLFLVAVLYEILGLVIAWVIKQIYWTPHRFRYGILLAGGWSNYGDIPMSVVMSITGAAPFDAPRDQVLAVAYVSVFFVVYTVTLFPCGGHRLAAKDYVGPGVEDEEVKQELRRKHKRWLSSKFYPASQQTRLKHDLEHLDENLPQAETATSLNAERRGSGAQHKHILSSNSETSIATEPFELHSPSTGSATEGPSRITSPTPSITGAALSVSESGCILQQPRSSLSADLPNPAESMRISDTSIIRYRRLSIILRTFITFIRSLCAPACIAIILSFPIAVVPQLKGLFVDVPGAGIPSAPGGQPPLAFIIDAASFIGAALALICLGSALARLKIPRNQWGTLPIGAITSLAAGKLLIMPVLGVLICQGLVNVGIIGEEDKVLRFVCIFFSCLPTATAQVFLTQVYSGTGSAEHVSAFLIPQYMLMFLSITVLTTYTLQMLF